MSSDDTCHLIYKSKPYQIQDQIAHKISKNVHKKLMKGECKYEIESRVSLEVLDMFIQYLVDGIEPEIHFDTIYEFQQLADEFEIQDLSEKVKQKREKFREMEKNAEISNSNIVAIKHLFESCIKLEKELKEQKKYYEFEIEKIREELMKEIASCDSKINKTSDEIYQKIKESSNYSEERLNKQQSIEEEKSNQIEVCKSNLELLKQQLTKQDEDNQIKYISKDISLIIFLNQISLFLLFNLISNNYFIDRISIFYIFYQITILKCLYHFKKKIQFISFYIIIFMTL